MSKTFYHRTWVADTQMVRTGFSITVTQTANVVERLSKYGNDWVIEEAWVNPMPNEIADYTPAELIEREYKLKALRILMSMVEKGMSDE
jgi:hypothetical protein